MPITEIEVELYNCHVCGYSFYGFEANSWVWAKNNIASYPICPECGRGDNINVARRDIKFQLREVK